MAPTKRGSSKARRSRPSQKLTVTLSIEATAYGQGVYFAVNASYSTESAIPTRALISKVSSTCIWRAWPWASSVWVTGT